MIRKYKNLILFLVITFGRSCAIVMFKFFLWSYLKETKSLEEILGFISLGGMFAFLIGGALSFSYKKKAITIAAGIISVIAIIIGIKANHNPYRIFVGEMILLGVAYGIWLTVKGILVSSEIIESKISETMMNALANVSLLLGMLFGCYRGFLSYDTRGGNGIWAIVGIFTISSFLSIFRGYDSIRPIQNFQKALKHTIPDIFMIIKKHIALLIPIGVLRATSTAIGQKVLELGIQSFNKEPKHTIRLLIVSMLGTIIGHALSAMIKKKKVFLSGSVIILFAICVILFPSFLGKHRTYMFLKGYSFLLGVLMGFVVNILEGRYYHLIGDEKMKENGSAAYGVANNIIAFIVMLTITFITKKLNLRYTFSFLGISLLACLPLIKRMK